MTMKYPRNRVIGAACRPELLRKVQIAAEREIRSVSSLAKAALISYLTVRHPDLMTGDVKNLV
jgi:hypothetical protein